MGSLKVGRLCGAGKITSIVKLVNPLEEALNLMKIVSRAGLSVTRTGQHVIIHIGNNVNRFIAKMDANSILREIKWIENGNTLEILENIKYIDNTGGEAIGNLAIVKEGDDVGIKAVSEAGDLLKQLVANVKSKFPDDLRKHWDNFVSDFGNNAELLKSFDNNPKLLYAWQRLIDAPDAIRKNIHLLDDVTSWPASWKLTKSGDGMMVSNSAGRQLGTVYPDKIVAPGRKVSGETGNALLNRSPLVKNMTYDVDGFIYKTDDLGRVLKTNADLDDVVRIRLGNQQIKAVDVKDGIRGTDQGGHIVGSRFFGPGEQINLYPQSANLNQGAWKQMENTWADAMVQGKDVKIQVEAVFEGTSLRPEAFEVSYWIDGAKTQRTFINQ